MLERLSRGNDDPPPVAAYGASPSETHDGLYLRMGLGVGYLQTSASVVGADLKLSGTAFGLDFALGGAVTQDLIIFGEFAFLSVDSPTVTYGGASGNANGVSFDRACRRWPPPRPTPARPSDKGPTLRGRA